MQNQLFANPRWKYYYDCYNIQILESSVERFNTVEKELYGNTGNNCRYMEGLKEDKVAHLQNTHAKQHSGFIFSLIFATAFLSCVFPVT